MPTPVSAKHARPTRRSRYPLRGYIGHNGAGKSAFAVRDLIPSLLAGRPCLSTVRLLDFENPRPCDDDGCTELDHPQHAAAHPLWIKWTSWDQALSVTHCDIFADEITGVASSRDYSSLPPEVGDLLMQLRRNDLTFSWTSPSWARADLLVREVTQCVTFCKGFFPGYVDSDRTWRARRLLYGISYDVLSEPGFDEENRRRHTVIARSAMWRPRLVFGAYDSLAPVSSLIARQRGGTCTTCGGRRAVERCACA